MSDLTKVGDYGMGMKWDVIELGCNGKFDLIPRNETRHRLIPQHSLPFGLPPVLSDLDNQIEDYLQCPEKLPIHDFEQAQKFWPRKPNFESLFSLDLSPLCTELRVERDPSTGKLNGFTEVEITPQGNARNSFLMSRLPGPPSEAVRGSTNNCPFLPGGMDEPVFNQIIDEVDNYNFETDLLTTPPGFTKGMKFDVEKFKPDEISTAVEKQEKNVLNLANILTMDNKFSFLVENKPSEKEDEENNEKNDLELKLIPNDPVTSELEEVIEREIPVLKISETQSRPSLISTDWAIVVDVKKIPDFDKRIPNMAYTWPFQLAEFQQHAILHLEQHDCVFVAAHTSAGKTVVAEYAIALSQRHRTRTIYTSPIKALSNQKYRDFKNRFEDVGLLTGDIQINDKATCLIMTTEILRSMLYRGADILRDVEWVVFDEVHYINDKERGVVWEEVLIMLPSQINIVMLSATVPNYLQFADWVGSTKKRKIYVIRTSKRSVPLEHHLYTGSGGKSKDELFQVIDSENKFVIKGYKEAQEAMLVHQAKMGGRPGNFSLNPKQEETMWTGLVRYLEKKDLLPVIAFILSRYRCDENAKRLQKIDLTTSREKEIIRSKFNKWIQQLKECDRKLPQVRRMKMFLENGIGVHHSGILPILKEIVEMLFQDGLVKFLLATETFAIGVNMPAKTVVFDAIRKHDGENFRTLLPSEYIQMAGRAGRLGKDTKGMVIVLCKTSVPDELTVKQMMLGEPTQLESKFRLTYSMILKLLSRKHFRVEDIIRRSFSEVLDAKAQVKFQARLGELNEKRDKLESISCKICSPDLQEFCERALTVIRLKDELQKNFFTSARSFDSQIMTIGRVVVLNYLSQGNTLGVIIKINLSSRGRSFKVLLLSQVDENPQQETEIEPINDLSEESLIKWRKIKALMEEKLFLPEGQCGHVVIEMNSKSVISVIPEVIKKLDCEKIINDWNKRQQPRFKHDPPNEACNTAIRELRRLSENSPMRLVANDIAAILKVKDINKISAFDSLISKLPTLTDFKCINCPNFETHLQHELRNVQVNQEIDECKFRLSDEALKSIPDYRARIEVLKELGYITEDGMIDYKGKVACVVSNHELMVTELVLDEKLMMDLQAPAIAGLLSSLVFQQRSKGDCSVMASMEEGKKMILDIARKINNIQKKQGVIEPIVDYLEQFNFEIADVVHEWANKMPFAEIAAMTDVQEGIIVRNIQRLDEIFRDLKCVAQLIGNPLLQQKMEEVSNCIRRDIVFAASLYTKDDE